MSEIHIFVHDAEGAGRMNRFVHTEFLALLKKAERELPWTSSMLQFRLLKNQLSGFIVKTPDF
jgi:hypothetical protein